VKEVTLERIAPLLNYLRAQPTLREVKRAAFHLKGRDFIHFHEEPEGIFADVLLSKGRVRMPVTTQAEQSELMDRIEVKLSSLTAHARKTQLWKERRR